MLAYKLQPEKTIAQTRIHQIGIANPATRIRQQDIPAYMGIKKMRLKKFFEHEHIQYRHFYLPANTKFNEIIGQENFNKLSERFIAGALALTEKALTDCLTKTTLIKEEIDFICCVTSTGFVVPSLSARISKQLGLRENCQRVDIVGMGCSAGLNGLSTVNNWCHKNPTKNALLICVEICSAIYTIDDTTRSAVVNSLFGDGVAIALLRNDPKTNHESNNGIHPKIIDFESHLLTEYIEELRFDWDEKKSSYSFYVGKNTPHVLAEVADQPLLRLLNKYKINKEQISHWIVHGGGNTVLLGMQNKLRLSNYDLRHTRSVLKAFGNLSSGSFLFSFKNLINENKIKEGDIGLIMTMGPGLAIEMALIQWGGF